MSLLQTLNFYDRVLYLQEMSKINHRPIEYQKALSSLTNKLMHQLIDNNHKINNLKLYYPEDCEDLDVFKDVAYGFDAFVVSIENGKYIMNRFGQNHNATAE